MERFENLDKAMCKELEKLDKKYGSDYGEMSEIDAHKAEMLYHALKSAETYYAMKDEEDEGEYSGANRRGRSYRRGGGGGSYARGRDMESGRYISREPGYSGRYPMDYEMPYWGRY